MNLIEFDINSGGNWILGNAHYGSMKPWTRIFDVKKHKFRIQFAKFHILKISFS